MGDMEKRVLAVCGGGVVDKKVEEKEEKEEEEEKSLMEGMAVLDFDMLCTTVAMQTQMGKWCKLNSNENDDEESSMLYSNGGVFRMWEGELFYDCFDDRLIALQSTCLPCYRFGKNMKRAGYGSCFLQGSVYLILLLIVLLSGVAYIITKTRCFVYLSAAFILFIGAYLAFYRVLMRKKFNIRDDNSFFDDCAYHLICPCCSLGQESRTLEMNNVQDGIWHGRGDTVCIGNSGLGSNVFYTPTPQAMSTEAPDP